ncbi:DUF1871 domain-containing protein [Staphylococcus felis]|uniref:DUF1871 family protein n=1 Tax=Staphylococcus felis TaxID=46127 RepID=UPI000E23220B|nr:DUF1871 family protein [Staphylococcus felis]REH89492.1 DUF1871 domain-containing protein [Staphylococcus felis]
MANNDLNIRLYQQLSTWNPMNFDDPTLGDAEVYEMMDAVHQYGEAHAIAQAFQNIFHFSFETLIPYDVCLEQAQKALQLQMACDL